MKVRKIFKTFVKKTMDTDKIKEQVMKGKSPLFSSSRKKLQHGWKNYEDQRGGKTLETYTKGIENSKFLLKKIKALDDIKMDESILEVGCNVGRNLNYLLENGFSKLHGIEINPNVIEFMKERYPKLYSNSHIIIGPLEEKIKEIKDNQFSLTFSMGVLQHIHPESNFIFKEISRVTSKYLITIEEENYYNPGGTFPRDYQKIFSDLGWNMLSTEKLENYGILCQCRIFKK